MRTLNGVSVDYLPAEVSLDAFDAMGLKNDPVLVKIVKALRTSEAGKPSAISISPLEIKGFSDKLARGLGAFESNSAMLTELDKILAVDTTRVGASDVAAFGAGSAVSLKTILAAYLKAYVAGEFVDRQGNEVAKPVIGAKIGNDTITGFEKVIVEAIFDYVYLTPAIYAPGGSEKVVDYVAIQPLLDAKTVVVTPLSQPATEYNVKLKNPISTDLFLQVYKDKQRDPVFNKAKKTPTFVKVFPKVVTTVSTDPRTGVTALEREAIEFSIQLSAQASSQLASLTTRLFGGIHIGFGILGKVSIGDNDTLAKLVETLAEVSSRRFLEAKSFDTFNRFSYHEVKDASGKVTDVDLQAQNYSDNESNGIKKGPADALILFLRVQMKLRGVLQ